MKRFLIKTLILCTTILILILILIIVPLPQYSYDLSILDKHALLVKTGTRKLVLAGGSNLAFGINSALLQEVMHLPVINTGFQAGCGLARILEDLSPYLQAGDILLIIPEYQHFSNIWNGGETAYELIFDTGFITYHQYRLLLSRNYRLPGPGEFRAYLDKKWEGIITQLHQTSQHPRAYSRYGFNEYGDYIRHLEFEPEPIQIMDPISSINQSYLAAFFRIIAQFYEQGVTVLLSYPSYEAQSFDASRDFIHELDAVFRQNQDMTVISEPEEYRFDQDYFFDSAYHLNKTGREIRTRRLAADLERWKEEK